MVILDSLPLSTNLLPFEIKNSATNEALYLEKSPSNPSEYLLYRKSDDDGPFDKLSLEKFETFERSIKNVVGIWATL
jgi:hypothetical protein